jgi:LDH2 family malate/lactate/ureidoglycolate dehydrogenase
MLDRFKVPEKDRVYVDSEQMRAAVETLLLKMDMPADDARRSADVLIQSDLRGVETHGVSNMLRVYVDWYSKGILNPRPNIRVLRESPATTTLDGDAGLGIQTAPIAMELAIEKADKHGMGSVTVQNGGHVGMLSYHAMLPLEHDMIGLCMSAGSVHPSLLPTFGAEPRFGTNPLAWAVPARKQPPFVFDVATSQVAGNKLGLATRVGAMLEPAWIAGLDGAPIMHETPMPKRGEYYVLPFGGTRENGSHKGYGFASVVEIMCQILSGNGATALNRGTMGQHYLAYKIEAFTDPERFKDDMDLFLEALANTPPAPGHDRVLYPGLPEHEELQQRLANGIPYHREVLEWFASISAELELGVELG